jgi:hypothetical protein
VHEEEAAIGFVKPLEFLDFFDFSSLTRDSLLIR